MNIGEENRENVMARIRQLWSEDKGCKICGEEKWNLSDAFFSLSQFGTNEDGSSQNVPLVILTCANCGNTIFFNAIMLGFRFERKEQPN